MAEILLADIKPNTWNPNQMMDSEFEELVSEVKHLGGPAKPLILRKNSHGYEIVDGEQTYKALQENGYISLQEGWYEIHELDDFEAMRQTYKRNQHGTHDPLKQGQLFKRMMNERGLNQSELAREMEVSEGTVRNSLEYVKAVDIRNGYEERKLRFYTQRIAQIGIRDIRHMNELPIELSDLWLDSGARPEDLPASGWSANYDPKMAVLIPDLQVRSCQLAIDRLHEIKDILRLWGFYQHEWKPRVGLVRKWSGGLLLDFAGALPYLQLLFNSRWCKNREWNQYIAHYLRNILEAISRPSGDMAKIILPIEIFNNWVNYPEGMNISEFERKLKAAADEIEVRPGELDIWRDQLHKYGPSELKNKGLSVTQAYKLWQALKTCQEDRVDKEILAQALPRAIAEILHDEKLNPGTSLFGIVGELRGDLEIKDEILSLGNKAEMLSKAKELLEDAAKHNAMLLGMAEGAGNIGPSSKQRKRFEAIIKTIQPMLDRLDMLQEPELALILAMLTNKDYLYIWATAIGCKFEPLHAVIDNKCVK